MMWEFGTGWWWPALGLPMILLWIGLIVLVIWIVMKIARSNGSGPKNDVLDIARERYAKGEISKEEFYQIKKDLS